MENERTGQTIKGYELQELVGKGGFGAVYRATQAQLKREVAVKVILPEHANNPDFIRRFDVEAEVVARLEHPHIIPLYDYWREPTGAYLVMRWLAGGSLRQSLDNEGPWTPERAVEMFDSVSKALYVAHRSRVVHRDIKPDNILLDPDGNAYLADFGIARSDDMSSQDQQAGFGTIRYGSPEQFKEGEITPQTDIYAMGLLLFEVLTGVHPFEDYTTSEIIYKHLHESLPDILILKPELPATINDIIQYATNKEPDARYPDILSMARDFREVISNHQNGETTIPNLMVTQQHLDEFEDITDFEDVDLPNPYKGLRAFVEADAENFYGRTGLVERLLGRLQEDVPDQRFLAVIGPSGSGKSSVIKAGLVPALRRGGMPSSEKWFITEMFPGSHPFEEMEAALMRVAIDPPESLLNLLREENGIARAIKRVLPADEETELFMVIDQFEEVFTQVEDEDIRTRFLNNLVLALADTRSRLRIVVTLRADFYDRPLQYLEFGELLRQRIETVLPMSPAELEEAIVRPAEQVGAFLEPGLAQTIINDVGEQPGTLPLLQYALTELFERRQGRLLTVGTYQEIGGVAGALAKRAEEIYESLDEEGQQATRQLFLRLVTLGEGAEDTRRRARLDEITSLSETIQRIVEQFGKSRLLAFDRDPLTRSPTVEVAHEALIRTWQRVREWLGESRDMLRLQRRLTASSMEWQESGKDAGFLARDSRLEQFKTLLNTDVLVLNQTERDYLDASIQAQEAAAEDEQRRQRTLQLARMTFLVILLVIGIVVWQWYNNRQLSIVNEQLSISEARAQELSLAANSQVALNNRNRDLAIALSLAAIDTSSEEIRARAETERALADAAYSPGTRFIYEGHESAVNAVAYTNGRVLSGSADGTVRLWDALTGEEINSFEAHTAAIRDIALGPDGTLAITASDDMTMKLWDIESGQELALFEGHTDVINAVDISPDGTQVLSGSADMTMRLWDLETGEELMVFEGFDGPVQEAVFHPMLPIALSQAFETSPILWDLETGEEMRRIDQQKPVGINIDVSASAFSPDGTRVLSSFGLDVHLWDFATGETLRIFSGHGSYVNSVAFSPDGLTAISSDRRGNSMRLWSISGGQELTRFEGHVGIIQDVAMSDDGSYAFSAAADNTVRVWQLTSGALIDTFPGPQDNVFSVDYAPDGESVITAGDDPIIYRLDLESGGIVQSYVGHEERVWIVKYSPDGQYIFSAGAESVALMWDVESGEIVHRFEGHEDTITTLDISPDGSRLATGSDDLTVRLWDVESGELLETLEDGNGQLRAVEFSPDGKLLLMGADRLGWLRDLESGEILHVLDGHTDRVNTVTFNQNGNWMVTGSGDGSMVLWDVATGENLQRFEGHSGQVRSVFFVLDDRNLITSSSDTTIRIWDVASGLEVRRLEGHLEWTNQAVPSPDGLYAISGAWDETLRLWHIHDLSALIAWTDDNRHVRELTCDERSRFGVQPFCEAE